MSSMMDRKGNVPLQVGRTEEDRFPLQGGRGVAEVNFYSFSTDNLCGLH